MSANSLFRNVLTCAMILQGVRLRAQVELLERDTMIFVGSKGAEDHKHHRQSLELYRADSSYSWSSGTLGRENGKFVVQGEVIRLFRDRGRMFRTYRLSRKCVLPLPDACTYDERLRRSSLFGGSLHRSRMIPHW